MSFDIHESNVNSALKHSRLFRPLWRCCVLDGRPLADLSWMLVASLSSTCNDNLQLPSQSIHAHMLTDWLIDSVRLNVPPNTLLCHGPKLVYVSGHSMLSIIRCETRWQLRCIIRASGICWRHICCSTYGSDYLILGAMYKRHYSLLLYQDSIVHTPVVAHLSCSRYPPVASRTPYWHRCRRHRLKVSSVSATHLSTSLQTSPTTLSTSCPSPPTKTNTA